MIRNWVLVGLLFLSSVQTSLAAGIDFDFDEYEKIHPYFAVFAGMSQKWEKGGEKGGPGGHAFLYVHGRCKDYSKDYPAWIPCDKAKFPPGLEHSGSGSSVNGDFTNIGAVAVPGLDPFLKGLQVNGKLTEADRQALIDWAVKFQVYKTVKVNAATIDPNLPADQYERAIAKNGIGTDFGAKLGRDIQFIVIPLDYEGVVALTDYDNAFNEPYVKGEIRHWTYLYDNCEMFASQELEAALVRKGTPRNLPLLKQLANLALPGNGLSTLRMLLHHGGMSLPKQWIFPKRYGIEFENMKNNPLWWKLIQEGRNPPVGMGVISGAIKSYQGDDLYSDDIWTAKIPHKILGANQVSSRVLKHPEFTQLPANFEYWGTAFQDVLEASLKAKQTPDRIRYQDWLRRMLDFRLNAMTTLGLKSCNELGRKQK